MLTELFDRHPSVQTAGFSSGAYKPGLQGMKELDERLASPWKRYKIVHVAGTNGKGSVSSMLAAGLAAQGFRVGLYTSPHLVDFRERIKIVGGEGFELIPKEFVWDFVQTTKLEGASFFEISTALAFQYFAACGVDYAVVETGLGGRLDSTNIITPALSVITSIGLDHCALLGSTLEQIAREKAGIVKRGIPVVVGQRLPETEGVFREVAQSLNSNLVFAQDAPCAAMAKALNPSDFDLRGPYQSQNILSALVALDMLEGLGESTLPYLKRSAAITGLRGRWEILREANPMIICDIGHNPAALEINFRRLGELSRPLYIVYGVMADKDYQRVIELMPREAHYWAVAPASERALKVERLAEAMEELKPHIADSVAQGAAEAIEEASREEGSVVYIGGSNFVVAEYLENLANNS